MSMPNLDTQTYPCQYEYVFVPVHTLTYRC